MKSRFEVQRKGIQKLKMILCVSRALKKWKKQFSNSKHRFYVLKQWQNTQRSYIDDLNIMTNDIQKPLKAAKLITEQEDRILFPNLKGIIELSENMRNCLRQKISQWNPIQTMVGESLMVYSKFFMIYSEYCNNSTKSNGIIQRLKSHPQIPKIKSKLNPYQLEDYTIKPVQRPGKYVLLLRDYLSHLPASHKDYKSIELAVSKYNQVNNRNNQSLQRQIKGQEMIKLHNKYGNIISDRKPGRQYLKSFTSRCLNFKCIVHVFNDMLLVLQKKNDDSEVLYKIIQLDGTSYVVSKDHLKYYENVVFVCGLYNSTHLYFDTLADFMNFKESIQKIIDNLFTSEEERKVRFIEAEQKKKNLAKIKVRFLEQKKREVIYKPKFEINVDSIIKSKEDVYFVLKFKMVRPFRSSQTIMTTLNTMLTIQSCLKLTHKNFQYSRLRHIPEEFGFIETAMNKRKIIQYRSFVIEHFLNLIFRYYNFNQNWKYVADQIGVFPSLFWFSTENFQCNCSQCIQIKTGQPIQYYVMLMKQLRKAKKLQYSTSSRLYPVQTQKNPDRDSNYKRPKLRSKDQCLSYTFNLLNFMTMYEKHYLTNFFQKMLVLQAEMGEINYILFPLQNTPLRANINIKIYLINIEQEYIEINLKEDKYVRQILQQIGFNNSLESVYDWGLYLYYEGEYTYISNDQKLLDFINKWGIDVEKSEEEIGDDSFFSQKIDHLKKWGEQFWGSKKGKIFMKKHLHFEHQLQIQACKDNKERYHFLINEVFGRIRYQNLSLSDSELISICALFLIKNEFEKVKYWTIDNIDIAPLKELLPAFRQPALKSNQFKEDIMSQIRDNYEQLQQFQNSRNAIEIIYLKTLNVLKNNQEWVTKYFPLTSYQSEIANDVQIGINYNFLTVTKTKQRRSVLQIELNRLKYVANMSTIVIHQGGKSYRYDGKEVYTIRRMVQVYLAYGRLFTNPNCSMIDPS